MRKKQTLLRKTLCLTLSAALVLGSTVLPFEGLSGSAVTHGSDGSFSGAISKVLSQAGTAKLASAKEADSAGYYTEDDYNSFEETADPYTAQLLSEQFGADVNPLIISEGAVKVSLNKNNDVADGLYLNGKNNPKKPTYITISKTFDFGSGYANRIRVDALGLLNTKSYVNIYVDNMVDPILKVRIKNQSKEDTWTDFKPAFVELPKGLFTGEHVITLGISDETTLSSKKTSMLIRSIKFYKESIPTITFDLDEEINTIEAMNSDKTKETECYGSMKINVPADFKDEYGSDYTGTHEYVLDYIRGRGNSTWNNEKKPYKVKLKESSDLFGMGSNKHWVLIANYYDNSFIRNRLTYYIGEKMGMAYTPQLVPVDVVMNGDYLGSYYLCEQIRLDKNRLDINDLEDITDTDTDITGGYLLAMEPYSTDTEYKFRTKQNVSFKINSPDELSECSDPDSRLAEMREYIVDYVNKAEAALYTDDFAADEYGMTYKDYIDIDSFAKYYLFQEFTMNSDGFTTPSTYLYKKQDKDGVPGKLYFGPLWDFDYVAWASANYNGWRDTHDYATLDPESEHGKITYSSVFSDFEWTKVVKSDPEFFEKLKEYWGSKDEPGTLRYWLEQAISDGGIIDKYYEELALSATNNFDKYGMTKMDLIFDEDQNYIFTCPCKDYKEEIDRLKNWIKTRAKWMDDNFDKYLLKNNTITFYDGETKIAEKTAYAGKKFVGVPTLEDKEDKIFVGWKTYSQNYEGETCEEEFFDNMYVDSDKDVYAVWVPKSEATYPKGIFFKFKDCYVPNDSLSILEYEFAPEDINIKKVKFTSSNPDIAIVDNNGLITPKAKSGDAIITVETANGLTDTCTVHVADKESIKNLLSGVSCEESKITLKQGEYKKINITTDPLGVINYTFTCLYSDEDVATVSENMVLEALEPGHTTIFIIFNDNPELSVKLHVTVNADDDDTTPTPDPGDTTPTPMVSPNPTVTTPAIITRPTAPVATATALILGEGSTFTVNKVKYMVTKAGTFNGKSVENGAVKVIAGKNKKLKKLSLPENVIHENNNFKVEKIKKKAFKGYKKLKSVTIPKSVSLVCKSAFKGCKKLKTIQIPGENTIVEKNAFSGINKKATVYVPESKLDTYKKMLKKSGCKNVKKLKLV